MFLTKSNDFKWKKFIAIFAVVVGLVGLGFLGFDRFLQPYFRSFDWHVWKLLAEFGKWKILATVALVFFLVARILRWLGYKFAIEKLFANIFCSIILSEFIVGILKICVGRARPPINGFVPFSLSSAWHSFPSGHAAAAFALLVSIGLMFPKAKAFFWALAIIAGIGRICIGAHWPSDVIFGAFIGMAAADFIVYSRRHLFSRR
ncbi:MAG: phosphatase PAP2 family protein [Rickettsiales bacterium]|jgi:membrane-associated phospholipid phosphatase|nr:phosphatase PAP2 family protein [Rickettsiales bacterium]